MSPVVAGEVSVTVNEYDAAAVPAFDRTGVVKDAPEPASQSSQVLEARIPAADERERKGHHLRSRPVCHVQAKRNALPFGPLL